MTHAQVLLASGAGTALAVALVAGWRERARKRRIDFDRLGLVAWPTVQMLALIVLAMCGLLALHVQ